MGEVWRFLLEPASVAKESNCGKRPKLRSLLRRLLQRRWRRKPWCPLCPYLSKIFQKLSKKIQRKSINSKTFKIYPKFFLKTELREMKEKALVSTMSLSVQNRPKIVQKNSKEIQKISKPLTTNLKFFLKQNWEQEMNEKALVSTLSISVYNCPKIGPKLSIKIKRNPINSKPLKSISNYFLKQKIEWCHVQLPVFIFLMWSS